MSLLGADPDALGALGTRLRAASRELELIAVGLERRVRAAGWSGRDAQAFEGEWHHRYRPQLLALADRFRDTANTLDRQAQEQIRASGGAPGTASGGASSGGATTARDAPLPAPDPLPRSEVHLLAGTELIGGVLVGGLAHALSVQQLPHSRSRVVVTSTNTAGLTATFGADVHGGGNAPLIGASASGQATLATITRREYLVRDDDVWPTVATVEAELGVARAVDATRSLPGVGAALGAVAPVVALWDRVVDRVSGHDVDLGAALDPWSIAPEPDRVETLTQVAISASVGASLASALGLDSGVDLSGAIRFGSATDGSDNADRGESGESGGGRILEFEGTAGTALSGALLDRASLALPGDVEQSATLRIELPAHPRDGVDLIVTRVQSDASGLRQQTSNIALSSIGLTSIAHDIAEATHQLQHGQLHTALQTLAGIDLSSDSPAVDSVVSATGAQSLVDHTTTGGARLGEGLGVGFSGEGGVQRFERVD